MNFIFQQAQSYETDKALSLLKSAAKSLQEKNINQWAFWLDPDAEKVKWVQEGFVNKEFYFIVCNRELAGMFRLLQSDELYWGKQDDKAVYIHSLIILEKFAGNQLGKKVMDKIMADTLKKGINLMRLDCNAANEKLCSYYEKLGFVKVGQKQMPHSLNNLYQKQLLNSIQS